MALINNSTGKSTPQILIFRGLGFQSAGRPRYWLVRCLYRKFSGPRKQKRPPFERRAFEATADQAAALGRTLDGKAIGLLALSLNSTVMNTRSLSPRFARSC